MNFFGHAAVAFRRHPGDPRVVFGAMLPDFASMCRARLHGADDPAAAAGIALHYATDDAFHGAPTFLELYMRGIDELERAGVARGAARAVAHVGTELVLDGLLLGEPALDAAYLDAVALPASELGLRFRGDGAARFEALHARLRGFGLPEDYRFADRVATRLEQILARRPRLALGPGDARRIVPFLESTTAALVDRLPALLREVDEALGARLDAAGSRD